MKVRTKSCKLSKVPRSCGVSLNDYARNYKSMPAVETSEIGLASIYIGIERVA